MNSAEKQAEHAADAGRAKEQDPPGELALLGVTAIVRSRADEATPPRAVRELLMREVHRRASALTVGARGRAAELRELVMDVANETLERLAGGHRVKEATVHVELAAAGEGAATATCVIAFGGVA